MLWLVLSSIPPLLFTISTVIDEYLVKNHFADKPLLFLIVACVLELVPALLALGFYEPASEIPFIHMLMFMGFGVLITFSMVPYLIAVQKDGAGVVVPFFQFTPVFVFLLGWLFLKEVVSSVQLFSCGLITAAAFVMSWDFHVKKVALRSGLLMMATCLMIAIFVVCLRYQMEEYGWFIPTIWVWLGNGVFGSTCLLLYKPCRDDFIAVFKNSSLRVSCMFVGQSFLDNGGGLIYIIALSIAPAAGLVQTMNGLQPLYILGLTVLLGIGVPQYFHKVAIDRMFLWRIMWAVVLFAGVGLLILDL